MTSYSLNKSKVRMLREPLEEMYSVYHRSEYLGLDPLICVHQFSTPDAIEIAGLVASVLAYGRVEIVVRNVRWLFATIGEDIAGFTTKSTFKQKCYCFKNFKHRFTSGYEIALLLECVAQIYETYGSLEKCFNVYSSATDATIRNGLAGFTREMKDRARELTGRRIQAFDYLLPSPDGGSACKRSNMYLRWMVRKADGIDFGTWTSISPSSLIIPVDTHVARIARTMGLTSRKAVDWRMAEEITNGLRHFDNDDPVRYDFSICRAGMKIFRDKSGVC